MLKRKKNSKKYFKISNNEKSQSLVLVIFIVIIFASTIASIASLTTRELEMEEIQERALNAQYAVETGDERAREILSRGYAVRLDGIDDYIDVGTEEEKPLFDTDDSTYEQFTIEVWFKIDSSKKDSLDFDNFKPIIIRGLKDQNCTGWVDPTNPANKGCVEGSIAVAGENVIFPEFPPGRYRYCPKRLHIILFYYFNYYDWVPITTDPGHQCTSDGGPDEIKPNKWYHLIVSYVQNPTPTYYIYLNGKYITYYQSAKNPSYQSGSYNIRIGAKMKNDSFFRGVIDEVRIYKHPRYCGNPPTFSSGTPNDPLNHYYGIYGYEDDIPDCLCPSSVWWCWLRVCPEDVCNNWRTQYYPSDYNMETHDLILHYDFDAPPDCYTDSTPGCIKDKSSIHNDGTPVGFNENGQEIPAAPNSKNPVFVDVTQYGKVVSLDKDTEAEDLNPMQNTFSYGFYIVPKGKTKEGQVCDCSNKTPDCCCDYYCIFSYTKGKE